RAAHIQQGGASVPFVPERHRALLNHEDVRLVRFPLPQDVVVRLVKPDAPSRGESEDIACLHRLKGRMLLEEVSDAVVDSRRVHRWSFAPRDSERVGAMSTDKNAGN